MNEHIKALVKKSAEANSALEAMQFSQAANNAANAYAVLVSIDPANNAEPPPRKDR